MYEGQSKSCHISLTSTVLCTMSSYCLGKVLIITFYEQVSKRLHDAQKKRQDKWQGQWFLHQIMHQATHSLLWRNSSLRKHSCHHPTTVLSCSCSKWLLAVPHSENGPQGDTFTHGGLQIKCTGQTSLPPVLPTIAGSAKHVRACKGPTMEVITSAMK
jgi:hypothetical protein